MEETRRFRIPLKPVLAVLVVAGVAANIPRGWFEEATPETRRAEVFSAFVNLSAEPGQGEFAFLQSLASMTGQATRAKKARLERVHPEVLRHYVARHELMAKAQGRVVPEAADIAAFALSGVTVSQPDFARHGRVGGWAWGVAEDHATRAVTGQGDLPGCGVAVVFWTNEDWFYAPIGLPEMDQILRESVPEMSDLPFAELPRCVADE